MATRVLSRRAAAARRDEADRDELEDETDEAPVLKARVRPSRARNPKDPAAKPASPPRTRKNPPKAPPRMFARWAVCDGGLNRLALFEYRDRAGADAKLAEMRERKTGAFLLQLVKDPYLPPVAGV